MLWLNFCNIRLTLTCDNYISKVTTFDPKGVDEYILASLKFFTSHLQRPLFLRLFLALSVECRRVTTLGAQSPRVLNPMILASTFTQTGNYVKITIGIVLVPITRIAFGFFLTEKVLVSAIFVIDHLYSHPLPVVGITILVMTVGIVEVT